VSISLGGITFDPAHTTVREKHEEVGGRDARRIAISGLIVGASSAEEIESALDAILAAASGNGYESELTLRSGRRLQVQRISFVREVSKDALAGSFVLELDAEDPFEESVDVRTLAWAVTASGDAISISGGGNSPSALVIALVASGDVVCPAFSDGRRTFAYAGTVRDGETLVFDGRQRVVTLGGVDVSAYSEGVFPQAAPEGAVLTYADSPESSHQASVTVTIRDRWW
jgi:hypothetical protein